MIENGIPSIDILSEEAMASLRAGWRRLMGDIGIEFQHQPALDLFAAAGQRVEGSVVKFDSDFVDEAVAKAPSEFQMLARNPDRSVRIGGDAMVFITGQGSPFIREGATRRDARLDDFHRLCKLAQSFDQLDSAGGIPCEPLDVDPDVRHLDMQHALITLTDRMYMGSQISLPAARDSLSMAAIVAGGRDELDRTPRLFSIANANSPLRFDERMSDAIVEYASAAQPVVITPFLLMGAMSPVTVPAALVQQIAEALAGLCLAQLVREAAPVILGSFLSNTDMQSGAPGFGGPESAQGLLCTGQIARSLGLPWRAGGGFLTSSPVPDAQAAYEGHNVMTFAFLAGANFVPHAAGWLESGLSVGYEKFVIDIEMLRVLIEEFKPLEVDEDSIAFDAHREVGHGGHFFGAAHTLTRFRDCFYRPLVSTTENFELWEERGAKDAAVRAAEIASSVLEAYEEPPFDGAIREELDRFVSSRRGEISSGAAT
jgi:trimethylamine--corrinoid protein Co-methyltransferase